ncbi:hypothetical protein F5Y17DRAFT_297857 [Xylariaceae sp. FL0594]|nr:hypothetical protein F5Y17DRAFT_297857 [Xylariaceae sp. FL0594]
MGKQLLLKRGRSKGSEKEGKPNQRIYFWLGGFVIRLRNGQKRCSKSKKEACSPSKQITSQLAVLFLLSRRSKELACAALIEAVSDGGKWMIWSKQSRFGYVGSMAAADLRYGPYGWVGLHQSADLQHMKFRGLGHSNQQSTTRHEEQSRYTTRRPRRYWRVRGGTLL